MSADFDLRSLVQQIAADSKAPEPNVVAEQVIHALPKEHLRTALVVAMRSYVSQVITSGRTNLHPPVTSLPPAPSSESEKWRQARSFLDDRIATDAGWKFIRDCTASDFLAAASRRRLMGAGNIRWAERYEKVAARLDEAGAATAGDLGEDAIKELLS